MSIPRRKPMQGRNGTGIWFKDTYAVPSCPHSLPEAVFDALEGGTAAGAFIRYYPNPADAMAALKAAKKRAGVKLV
jgi:hypothetical protein